MVAGGIPGSMVDTGAAGDTEAVSAFDVVLEFGVKGPERGVNTIGGSQIPEIPTVQVVQAGSRLYSSVGIDRRGEHGSYVIWGRFAFHAALWTSLVDPDGAVELYLPSAPLMAVRFPQSPVDEK